MRAEYDHRPETYALLADQFFTTFPQLEGLAFTHQWGGAIDACSRFTAFWGRAYRGRVAYVAGYTGLGVGSSRFGARVLLDLVDNLQTERTALDLVRSKPLPFPPEPLRYAAIALTKRAIAKADRNNGQRGAVAAHPRPHGTGVRLVTREADVIIVGAGLSGLIAAREVLRAGREPLVLEASDRVGGRILTEEPAPGVFLELGAQWIGDTHHRMIALADDLGVALYPQFEVGETSYEFNGVVQREAAFHAQHADDVAAVERVLRQLDAMAATVSVAEPWAAPDADAWDRITVAQWYDSHGLSAVGRELLEICTVGILAVPTSEVSLLGLLVNVVTCGVTRRPAFGVRRRRPDAALRRRHGPDPEAPGRPARRTGRAQRTRPDHRVLG